MIPHPLPAVTGIDAGENVEAGLEPGRETLRNLDGLVPGVRGRQHSIHDAFRPAEGEVAVQLDHGPFGPHGLRGIDLNLIVFLCRYLKCQRDRKS